MLKVTRKLKAVCWSNDPKASANCDVYNGVITYPIWLLTEGNNALIIHYVLHETTHLRLPANINHEEQFKKYERRINKKFGIRLWYDHAYASSLYDSEGFLLWKTGYHKSPTIQAACRPLAVDWRKVSGYC
jgi:hypothetical protein